MKKVFIFRCFSNKQPYRSIVCGNVKTVLHCLDEMNMIPVPSHIAIKNERECLDNDYWTYMSSKDKTQTVVVTCKAVMFVKET